MTAARTALAFPSHRGTSWRQYSGNPILEPTAGWETTAVQEPEVVYDHATGLWRIFYTGGWDNPAIGTATSTDGFTWTKYAGNPIIGPDAAHFGLHYDGTTFRLFYANGAGAGATIYLATSTDGESWVDEGEVLAVPAWATQLANCDVVLADGTWHMLYDARSTSPVRWKVGHATASDPTAFTDDGLGPIDAFSFGGSTGSVCILSVPHDGGFRVFFHAVPAGEPLPDLPTDMYVMDAVDDSLRQYTTPTKILTRSQAWEVDQVADACVAGGRLFFAGLDNASEAAAIGVALP